jgi:hypothetical protein
MPIAKTRIKADIIFATNRIGFSLSITTPHFLAVFAACQAGSISGLGKYPVSTIQIQHPVLIGVANFDPIASTSKLLLAAFVRACLQKKRD